MKTGSVGLLAESAVARIRAAMENSAIDSLPADYTSAAIAEPVADDTCPALSGHEPAGQTLPGWADMMCD